jgi:hypothetical protein
MKPFLNSLIVALFVIAGVIGIVEAREVSQFSKQIQSLRRQQATPTAQIGQLEQQRDDATNRLVALQAGNENAATGAQMLELLRLRGEASRLEANEAERASDPDATTEDTWVARVNQLKQYAAQHPDDAIPEFQYLSPREWLIVTDSSNSTELASTMGDLRFQAEGKFAVAVSDALTEYTKANNGQFPDELSQLLPYADAGMEEILQQRYQIQPVSVVGQSNIQFSGLKGDHVITSRFTLQNGSSTHIAIYPNGSTYF